MRIRRLELVGFKSFPDRTNLVFGDGVSCIVGPNGCGKSNIVDAIRWVMGEQSAKSLRAGEMNDVIFGGAEGRGQVGFAEVSLTFTAEGGAPFPGEYAAAEELEITRRMHRTGASEYLINRSRVRRRDLQDLFLDTGIGNDLYSFIEQGRIGKIIQASPEERRALVDEAAGITRYRVKRDEALAQLEATSGQLDRVADLADELEKRVAALRRQVRKVMTARSFQVRGKQLEIWITLASVSGWAADRQATRTRLVHMEAKLKALELDLDRRRLDLAQRREELSLTEDAVQRVREALTEADGEVKTAEAERRLLERSRAEAGERLGREESALLAAMEEGERAAAELDSLAAAEVLAEADVAAFSEGVVAVGGRLAQRHEEALRADRALAHARDEEARAARVVETERQRLADLHTRLAEERATAARATAAQEAAREQLAHAQGAVAALVAGLAAAEDAERAAVGAVEAARVRWQASAAKAKEASDPWREAGARLERLRAEGRARVRDLEGALAAAERDGARRLKELDQQADREYASLRDRRDSATAAVREGVARARSGAVARRDRWLEVADRLTTRLAGEEEDRSMRARRALEQSAADALGARDRADASALSELERALTEAHHSALTPLQARAASGAAAFREARGRAAALRARVRDLERERADSQGREAALSGRIAEENRRRAGSGALAKLLEGRPTWASVLDVLPDTLAEIARWSGDRLLLPVLRDRAALAAAIASGGAGRFVWIPPGADPAEGLRRWQLRAAGELGARGEEVSLDGRVQIAADGVVTVGVASEAVAVLELTRELEGRVARRRALEEELRATIASAETMERAAREGEEEERTSTVKIRELESSFRQSLTQQLGAARAAAARAREAHTREGAAALAAFQREAAARIEALRRAARAQREAWAKQGEAGLSAWDAAARHQTILEVEAREETYRRALEAARAQFAAAREALAATREAAVTAVAAARTALAEAETPAEAEVAEARARADEAAALERADSSALAEVERALGEARLRVARAQGERARALSDQSAREAADSAAAKAVVEGGERRARMAAAAMSLEFSIASAEAHAAAVTGAREVAEASARGASADHLADATEAEAMKGRAATARANLESLKVRKEEREGVWLGATARVERGEQQLDAIRAEISGLDEGILAAHMRREAAAEARVAAVERLEVERQRAAGMRERGAELERALAEQGLLRDNTQREVESLAARVADLKEKIAGAKARMEERYQLGVIGILDRMDAMGTFGVEGFSAEEFPELEVLPVTLRAADLEADLSARGEEWAGVRRAQESLGEVQYGAVEEYEETRGRLTDLRAQAEDLEGSIGRLRGAVAQMNRHSRERFRDTFELVDQRFRATYPELAGGGVAHLALTDQEDLLTAGVEVFAAPAGKTMKRMSLLSGGEQAMVGIALILALFQVKPAPFCVMDEVDAPLDEANGARFNRMLKAMSGISQFVLITHNRFTMEHADTLYGVTMPTPGASRLVSVRIGH